METEKFSSGLTQHRLYDDFSDFCFDIWDNGDSKVSLVFFLDTKKSIKIECNMFMPELEPCHAIFAGQGQGVFLKQMEISQQRRDCHIIENDYHQLGVRRCVSREIDQDHLH